MTCTLTSDLPHSLKPHVYVVVYIYAQFVIDFFDVCPISPLSVWYYWCANDCCLVLNIGACIWLCQVVFGSLVLFSSMLVVSRCATVFVYVSQCVSVTWFQQRLPTAPDTGVF